jgi:hypothetical protein
MGSLATVGSAGGVRPGSGERHRFTELLPRIVDVTVSERVCEECTTRLEPWEGQPSPRLYGFTAKQVAKALVLVAGGASYRATAALIRRDAGRELGTAARRDRSGRPLAPPNQHGQLVSDWVEVFAPVIWASYAPTSWPAAVLLDEDEFRFCRPGAARGVLAFVTLAAVGYTRQGLPFVTAIEAVPRCTVPAWQAFLSRLDGTPELIVTDGGLARRAAERLWPLPGATQVPELRRCEWHLARNITQSLPQDVQRDRADPIHHLIAGAQLSPSGWQALHDEITSRALVGGYLAAVKVISAKDTQVRHQIATRTLSGPHSTGPLEQFFHHLDATIGDRAARLTNKTRADALLKLVAAQRNGWANETAWAERIREHLLARQGRAPDQRQHTDPAAEPSLRAPLPPPAMVDF